MCGIFGYIGSNKNSGDIILDGLKTLEYRGYDSWGVAVKKTDGTIFIEKHTGKIGDAHLPSMETHMGIGHTRWATHGGVTKENAHPHTDCTKDVIVVHNGIVENFEELKKDLIAKGHTFLSETDSEVLAHLIEEELKTEKDMLTVIQTMWKKITGMNAVISFFPKQEAIYVVKNGSPLVYGKAEDGAYLASDSSALIKHTKEVYFLEDNDLLEIKEETTTLYKDTEKEHDVSFTTLQYDASAAELGSYDHFMMKEIIEQPHVLQNIIDTQQSAIAEASDRIKKAFGTYLIGCGTASYACLAGTYLFSKIAKKHINNATASEFTYSLDFLKDDSLVIALSQSGETIDILSSVKKAREKKANIMALTNALGSSLYRFADYNMLLNAGPEKAVASTKAYTSKIAFLYLIAHHLNSTDELGKERLESAIAEMHHIFERKETIKQITEDIKDKDHIFVLGRGISYPAALEAALKIKEVSYIHAEGFASGELKHGVIALIEKGTPVIIFNPEDETYEDVLSAAHEVKARGAYVIGISSKPNTIYDEYIEVKNCWNATIVPNVVIAQLMGYYLALAKGYDPDKPRNLAKSVTVK